jgi:hypothetical protein
LSGRSLHVYLFKHFKHLLCIHFQTGIANITETSVPEEDLQITVI